MTVIIDHGTFIGLLNMPARLLIMSGTPAQNGRALRSLRAVYTLTIASRILSSEKFNRCFSSEIKNRRLRSPFAFMKRGTTVSSASSSALRYITLIGSCDTPVNGSVSPRVRRAARLRANVLLPSPESPCISVTFPNGIYGYQSHFTSFGLTSAAVNNSSGARIKLLLSDIYYHFPSVHM